MEKINNDYIIGLLDTQNIILDEAEAILNDIVEGDNESRNLMNFGATVLLNVAHDIRNRVKISLDKL